MAAKIIVMVSDRDDARRGEITVLDDPRRAEALVETLLEAGFDHERIQLFSGSQTDMRISSRPVVALVDEAAPAAVSEGRHSEGAVEPDAAAWQTVEEEATPYVKDGVRFSSLFRTA